jgi:protein TonB
MDRLYRARNWVASGPSVLLFLAAVILTTLHTPTKIKKVDHQTPMRVTIAPPQVEPPPPMPEMPQLPEVTPDVSTPVVPTFTPRTVTRTAPSPKAAPTPTPTPAPAASEQPAAVAPQAVAAPAVARPAPPTAVSSDDEVYKAQIRAYLEGIKHYPTSKEARLQRPRGTVNVWIVIDRSGGMKEAGIEESSGSLILDGAALSTVRNASYPAFPADAFKGEPTHRFTVQLNYSMS